MNRPAAYRPNAKRRTTLVLESHVQQTVTELLQFDGWRAFRTEHAIERSNDEQRRFKRRVGEPGQPDYQYVRYLSGDCIIIDTRETRTKAILKSPAAEVMYIEFKKQGEEPEPKQLKWHAAERARGALVLVVDDIDEFRKWYEASGLKRR
jgi:hypothetical protein